MIVYEQTNGSLTFDGDTMTIKDFKMTNPELTRYLLSFPMDDQTSKLSDLVEVGLFCTQRTAVRQDKDFVENQLRDVVGSVEKVMANIPELVKQKVLSGLGTGEGQALHPVNTKVDEISAVLKHRMDDVRKLLSDDIDPQKETSKVAQVFNKLEKALDPNYFHSVPKTIEQAVSDITGENGNIAKNVKSVVLDSIKPLQEQVDQLSKQLLSQAAVSEALQNTTEKGIEYEEQTVTRIQSWFGDSGVEVHHVGSDNKPGDIVLKVSDKSMYGTGVEVVIETKDRQDPMGRKRISDVMEKSMSERSASYGIYLSKCVEGLGKEIGDWAEGDCSLGSWIATTDEQLLIAIRWLLLNHRVADQKSQTPDFDVQTIVPSVESIKTSLKRVSKISKNGTLINQAADDIKKEGQTLRDEIRGALTKVEENLRITN